MSSNFVSTTLKQLRGLPMNADPTVLGGTKRFSSADGLSSAVMGSVMNKQLKAAAGIGSAIQLGFPGGLAGSVRVVHTGHSTLDQQTDEIIVQPIMPRPYAEGWHRSFSNYTPLFSNRYEEIYKNDGTFTVADPPILNYFLEQAAVLSASTNFLRQELLPDARSLRARYSNFMAKSPQEFAKKWSHLGVMMSRQPGGYRTSGASRRVSGNESQIGYSCIGRAYTFNLFAPDVRPGQKLYYIVRDFEAEDPNFLDPTGQIIAARSSNPGTFLQMRGFTDKEADTVPIYNASAYSVSQLYRRQAMRINQEYMEYDVDEFGDIVMARDLTDEGMQEMENNVPDLVYEMYEIGHVMRAGISREIKGAPNTHREILIGHRDQEAMKALQIVHFYNGL